MNRSWVRFPQAAQIRPPGSGWAFLYARVVLLVAPRVFRAPEAPAAREARRPHFVRRRASKPARALRSLRRPPHLWGRAAVCAGGRRPAREIATHEPAARSGRSRGPPWPCHRPPAPRPGPAFCSSPVPSGPSGALHTSGAGVLLCSLARRLEARPGPATAHGHRSRVLWTPNAVWLVVLGFWGAPLCVVTNVVNRRCFSCGFLIRCYKRRQSEGFFAENQGFWTQIDDVCNMSTRKGVQTVPV